MQLSDEQRKKLTEFLGECWHDSEPHFLSEIGLEHSFKCKKCGQLGPITHRTFTTPDDQQALIDRLVNTWRWNDFYLWVEHQAPFGLPHEAKVAWLISTSPEGLRLPGLVADWPGLEQ